MNRLVIIGAGGHGKVVADTALKQGYQDIIFLDDNATGICAGFMIMGSTTEIKSLNDGTTDFVIAVGNNAIRKKIADKYDINWVTLIHPAAIIGKGVKIGKGTVVTAGAVINPDAIIGEHCIINTSSVVEHDNVLGDFVHLSPNATLGGTVCVGARTHVGMSAVVRNNINICSDCIIGAGAVVVKDIEEPATYIGVPAQMLKK